MPMQSSLTFRRGERLSAQKMNALAQMAAQIDRANSSQTNRPGTGLGWRGNATWSDSHIECQNPQNPGRNRPFEIYAAFKAQTSASAANEISAYILKRNVWHDGDDFHRIQDTVISHDEIGDVSSIYLVELSSIGSGQPPVEIPMPEQDRWKVLSDWQIRNEYPSQYGDGQSDVARKWLLYNVVSGLITLDVRDAFVQTGGNMDITGGPGNINLDLSSLDWLTAQDAEPSAQVWHYNNIEQEDLATANFDKQATDSRVDSWRFLARPEDGGTLQYVQLSGIVGELSSISSEISALSAELSVEVSSTTIMGNVQGSVPIAGDIFVDAMLSSNVSCLTEIDQNNVSRCHIGVYYLGWMLPLFTMLSM